MSKDIILQGSEAEFTVSVIGKQTGETFQGTFKVKCFLSPIDTIKADKLYRELLGSITPHLASTEAQNMCFALSQLKYRVKQSPAGWKNEEIDGGHLDMNIVVDVLNHAIEAQTMYQQRSKERLKKLQDQLTKDIKDGKIQPEEELELPNDGGDV
jgi:hypothetical protein